VLGRKGDTIKAIGSTARAAMIEFFDRPVHLFLTVKVAENWAEDKAHYENRGLNFES
jgi:GTPase